MNVVKTAEDIAHDGTGIVFINNASLAEGIISLEEIFDHIYSFFETQGYPLTRDKWITVNLTEEEYLRAYEKSLYGEVSLRTRNHSHREGSYIQGSIILYLKQIKNGGVFDFKYNFLLTLFHELDHVVWYLEGRPFEDCVIYEERLHEKRAFEREEIFAKRALSWEFSCLRRVDVLLKHIQTLNMEAALLQDNLEKMRFRFNFIKWVRIHRQILKKFERSDGLLRKVEALRLKAGLW